MVADLTLGKMGPSPTFASDLLCLGDAFQVSWTQPQEGRAQEVLEIRVSGALSKLTSVQKQARILLAYESVRAISVNGIPEASNYADAASRDHLCRGRHSGSPRTVRLLRLHQPRELRRTDHLPAYRRAFHRAFGQNVAGYLDILTKFAAKL